MAVETLLIVPGRTLHCSSERKRVFLLPGSKTTFEGSLIGWTVGRETSRRPQRRNKDLRLQSDPLPPMSCVTLGKLLNISGHYFHHRLTQRSATCLTEVGCALQECVINSMNHCTGSTAQCHSTLCQIFLFLITWL